MKIEIDVITGAGRNEIRRIGDLNYKIWIVKKPVEGEANKMVISMLSDYLGVAPSLISIIKGIKNRHKIIEIGAN